MKNAIWYLGFLSPLSLLYFATGEIGFVGFAGFAVYFTVHGEDDERLQRNVGLATRNAFFYVVFAGALSLIYLIIVKEQSFFPMAFTLLFSGGIIVCILSYLFYNIQEARL